MDPNGSVWLCVVRRMTSDKTNQVLTIPDNCINFEKNIRMSNLQKAMELLDSLTREEKVQLLEWVTHELSTNLDGIEKTPGVCGGVARIAGTRVPVWSLVQAQKMGYSDTRILYEYPRLKADDLKNAWHYFDEHKEEIELQIQQN